MFFKRITSDGLSHHSYLIGSGKEAAVMDPRRDWWVYTREAKGDDVAALDQEYHKVPGELRQLKDNLENRS